MNSNSFLVKMLLWFNNKTRKPVILEKPEFLKEILNDFTAIKKEWKIYSKGLNGIKPIDEISEDQKELNATKKWDALVLYAYGNKNDKALGAFRNVEKLIDKHCAEIQMVMFSILKPGMHILPHKGNLNHVLRSQVIIENQDARNTGLKINKQTFILQAGEAIVFDDTFEHEAWNNSKTNRVALIIDYKKSFPAFFNTINTRFLNQFSNSEYVTSVLKKW